VKGSAAAGSSPALIILDMISLFDFEGGAALLRQARCIVPGIVRLKRRFRAAGRPVIYVNDNFMDWRRDFRQLLAISARAGAPGADIATALWPEHDDYYILKPKHSGFLCTALPILLQSLAVDHLVLCGVAADSCVLVTAQDAHMRDLRLSVPADCVAAQSRQRTGRALGLMATTMHVDRRRSGLVAKSLLG
jgi:nicotinamidase-related amidase